MSSSTRLGTRISTRVNKLAARKVADRDAIQQICDQPAARKLMTWLDTVLQVCFITQNLFLIFYKCLDRRFVSHQFIHDVVVISFMITLKKCTST